MNDQRVKTDNEAAIAEFMGWERYSQNSFKCPNTYPIHNNTSNGWTTFSADQLEFGSRWDWFMPVVDKINKLEDSEELKGIDLDIIRSMHEWISMVELENACADAVSIIKWYQKQKSS